MRTVPFLLASCLLVGACSGSGNKADQDQAEALDNAASQSDPAAASELHNRADSIRNTGSQANLSDPNAPAQKALQSAGNAAAANSSSPSHQ